MSRPDRASLANDLEPAARAASTGQRWPSRAPEQPADDAPRSGAIATPPAGSEASPTGLMALEVTGFDPATGRAALRLGAAVIEARLDAPLDPVVVEGALARRERLIVQREEGEHVVLGALRTAPTPGIDPGDSYVIEARRVTLRGEHEVALLTGASSVVLRALGHIELLSRNITSRASGVQKLIARMIHLN
ncbi:hypothetical protein [Sorangium sp. So ce406]|uniref:hypothetical protein n=1 Tax=Sorangium sp. So ce406 TaxID=3133311 RepID=UPI003F5B4AF2